MDKSFREINKLISVRFHLSNKATYNLPYCSGQRLNRFHLCHLFNELGYKIGVEIGVRRGRYSKQLLKCNPGLKMYCVDPWDAIGNKYSQEKQEDIYAMAKKVLEPYDVTFVRKMSLDAVKDFENDFFDFIYIDGNHHFDFVMRDLIEWYPKLKRNGIIGVHDYYNGETGVLNAVDAFVRSHDVRPWYITKELAPTAYWVKK
jgi:hypothetical protein